MLELVFDGGERICQSVLLLFCYKVDYCIYVVKRMFIKNERVSESIGKTKLDKTSSDSYLQ